MRLTPLHLVSAHPWRQVVFTTYALSLSFFEAVILDALVRAGSRARPLLIADVHGVRESLSEQGAHQVGKDYEVEPVSISGGVFHSKITVLASDNQCHLMIGSGNLTFNGWGGNCELVEHLHPEFAPDAVADVAAFFERLSDSPRARHGVGRHCAEIASTLRGSIQGRSRNGEIRFLHNFDRSLTDQIVEAAEELGGAKRVVAVAPYWDSGAALDRLSRELGVKEAFIHAHAHGTVEGTAGSNWPSEARTRIHAVRAEPFDIPSEDRRLHAKAVEILCQRGRLVVSGSANGTSAALGQDGNIEACVLRIQSNRNARWKLVRTAPLDPQAPREGVDENEEPRVGILRAVLQADLLTGQILAPRMTGKVLVEHLTMYGPQRLADAVLDSEGKFTVAVPDLETRSWRGGRLVLRVIDTLGRQAEGFVSVASFAEIARKGGALTPRLLALIFGTETPEDVSAILGWFLEDTHRLSPGTSAVRGNDEQQKLDESEQLVPVAALNGQFTVEPGSLGSADTVGQHGWSRFLEQVLAAFRETRPPFGPNGSDESGDDDEIHQAESGRSDVAIDKAYASFEQLFDILTVESCPARHAEIAFDLTGFICARLRPDLVRSRIWLTTTIRTWLRAGVRPERQEDVAAAILTLFGVAPDEASARRTRNSLLKLGCDLSADPPTDAGVRNFLTVLQQRESFTDLWARIRAVLTYQEQIQAYLRALERRAPASKQAYPDLHVAAAEAWPVLAQALASSSARGRVVLANDSSGACPKCHISLPMQELDKLETIGVAVAKNCCGRVVIRSRA